MQEMRQHHANAMQKKGKDKSEVDMSSYIYRDLPALPVLAPEDYNTYLTPFHTYQINEGLHEDFIAHLNKAMSSSTANTRDVIVSPKRDVFTAQYKKKITHAKEGGEEEVQVKTETHEVIIQVRVFRLSKEENAPSYFTVFRQGDRDVAKEFLTHLDPVYNFCTHYTPNLDSEMIYEHSDDEFEENPGYDAEAAEAEWQKLLAEAEQNVMGEN